MKKIILIIVATAFFCRDTFSQESDDPLVVDFLLDLSMIDQKSFWTEAMGFDLAMTNYETCILTFDNNSGDITMVDFSAGWEYIEGIVLIFESPIVYNQYIEYAIEHFSEESISNQGRLFIHNEVNANIDFRIRSDLGSGKYTISIYPF